MTKATLQKLVFDALEDMKATDITELDVRGLTSITDTMFICTGRSSRHVVSIAENVMEKMKAAGYPALGSSGQEDAEWVLVDLDHVLVHVMQAETRQFYDLESLWTATEALLEKQKRMALIEE